MATGAQSAFCQALCKWTVLGSARLSGDHRAVHHHPQVALLGPRAARRRSRGQSVVEFAILFPFMLLLLLGAVDFGRAFFAYISAMNAAREGASYAARYAANEPYSSTDFTNAVIAAATGQSNVQGTSGAGAMTVTVECHPAGSASVVDCNSASNFATGAGNQATVRVAQTFTFLTPFITDLFGGPLTFTAGATAPVLNPLVAPAAPSVSPTATTPPTPTPTVAPTPTPTVAPTPTPTPGPTPTPVPTPTPTATPIPCVTPTLTLTPASTSGGNKQTSITVNFLGTLSGATATSWNWDFGDGATSASGSSTSHAFTYTGTIGNNGHGNGPQTWTVTVVAHFAAPPGCSPSLTSLTRTATVVLDP